MGDNMTIPEEFANEPATQVQDIVAHYQAIDPKSSITNHHHQEFSSPESKEKLPRRKKKSSKRATRPLTSYFTPFESLGLEVSALDSVTRHLFYIGLEAGKPSKMPGLRPLRPLLSTTIGSNADSNHSNLISQPKRSTSDAHHSQNKKSFQTQTKENSYTCINFTRNRFDESENHVQARVRRLVNLNPQSLHLTGKKDSGILEGQQYVFTRYYQGLQMDIPNKNIPKPIVENVNVTREIFYRSSNFDPSRKYKVEILGVDLQDRIELKIKEPTIREDYQYLARLLTAYYDVTLTNPKKERVPLEKIREGMIAVALISPKTSLARFIRVRVGKVNLNLMNMNKREYYSLTVSAVDEGSSYEVPLEDLYYIDPDFMQLPFMVNKYQLQGLDFYQGTMIIHEVFEKLVNTNSEKFKAIFSTKPDNENILFAELSLGRGNLEQPVNYLFQQALHNYLRPAVQSDFKDAKICHCDSKGNLWLHFQNKVLPKVLNFCKDDSFLQKFKQQTLDSIAEGVVNKQLFVARSSVDGKMYRVRVDRILYRQNKIAVEFVDWGYLETILVNGIYKASDIDRNYSVLPPQALKVRLNDVTRILNFERFKEIFSNTVVKVREIQNEYDSPKKIMRVTSCVGSGMGSSFLIPTEKYFIRTTNLGTYNPITGKYSL